MSNRYESFNEPTADDGYEVWEVDEHGAKVRLVNPVQELNRLERLVTDSVNAAHKLDRDKVEVAFYKEAIYGRDVSELREHPPAPDDPRFCSQFVTVRRDYWNRMVRVLKTVATEFWLP